MSGLPPASSALKAQQFMKTGSVATGYTSQLYLPQDVDWDLCADAQIFFGLKIFQ